MQGYLMSFHDKSCYMCYVRFQFDLADLKPYDAKLMVPIDTKPVDLVLEGSHVGRGDKW